MAKKTRMTYKQAGVDIRKADAFIDSVKAAIKTTNRKGTVGRIGGFAACFRPPYKGMKDPLLVSSTDGVGTKLLVAQAQKKHDTIGIDLVAMSVNDLICCGAEPLFFLDYMLTGGLKVGVSRAAIQGIVKGCRQANCALIGGETAEHPGHLSKGDYDLAGFSIGIVDRPNLVTGQKVRPGDVIMGLFSSGLHSNGFSLVRRVFTRRELAGAWGRTLLTPTIIYVRGVLALVKKGLAKAIANITGGGFEGNIPRVLPDRTAALVYRNTWRIPGVFEEIRRRGNISGPEMYRTFNMGIGMAIVVDKKQVRPAMTLLARHKIKSAAIGKIIRSDKKRCILAPVF
jgi:phosphoribosylformylglycinamidine cyclo-ligase